MAPCRPTWFEEPVPHTNIAAMVEVARHSRGADSHRRESLHQAAVRGACLSTKCQYHSARTFECRRYSSRHAKIADMVDAHFGVIAPHSAQGPVCSAACAQLNAAIPNFFIHEIFDEFNEPWEKEIVTNPVHVVDGYIEISERPGLGIDLNIEEILKHPYSRRTRYRSSNQVGKGGKRNPHIKHGARWGDRP